MAMERRTAACPPLQTHSRLACAPPHPAAATHQQARAGSARVLQALRAVCREWGCPLTHLHGTPICSAACLQRRRRDPPSLPHVHRALAHSRTAGCLPALHRPALARGVPAHHGGEVAWLRQPVVPVGGPPRRPGGRCERGREQPPGAAPAAQPATHAAVAHGCTLCLPALRRAGPACMPHASAVGAGTTAARATGLWVWLRRIGPCGCSPAPAPCKSSTVG